MITIGFLIFFELVGAILGFLVYVAMNEFNECVTADTLDNMTPFRRDRLVAAKRQHEIAANALMTWSVICLLAFAFTLLANL